MLVEDQEKIAELQATLETVPAANSDSMDYLVGFDDTDATVLPVAGSDEIVSLCGVISDYKGPKWLIRHADLSHDGQYHIFHRIEGIPPYFTNRNKIFYKNGPSDDGFYGLWTWSAMPNENDPSKDYVISQYSTNINVIEIVIVQEASSLDELIRLLKSGIEYPRHSRRVMFSFYVSK